MQIQRESKKIPTQPFYFYTECSSRRENGECMSNFVNGRNRESDKARKLCKIKI